jgi:hypothetical protein
MSLRRPSPLDIVRVRRIPQSFSWTDRRLLTENFLPYLSHEEIALYFFLVIASDRNGMSFYGLRRICVSLGFSETTLHLALEGLREMELVEYDFPYFQVLELPERPKPTSSRLKRALERRKGQ